jgi:polysaccharide export outer membrane protein
MTTSHSPAFRILCWTLALCLGAQGLPAILRAGDAPALPLTTEHFSYPPFLIGPGDLLTVNVFGEKDLPSSFLVDSSGTIVFPPIGAVDLGGLTQVEASRVLTAALAKFIKDPMVTVLVNDSAQYTVSVIGSVSKPGKFLIRGLPTLLGALAEAGGPLSDAALNRTVLVRNNRTYELSMGDFLKTGNGVQPEPVLFPGDIIYVPASRWPNLGDWGIIVSILSSAAVLFEIAKAEAHGNNP